MDRRCSRAVLEDAAIWVRERGANGTNDSSRFALGSFPLLVVPPRLRQLSIVDCFCNSTISYPSSSHVFARSTHNRNLDRSRCMRKQFAGSQRLFAIAIESSERASSIVRCCFRSSCCLECRFSIGLQVWEGWRKKRRSAEKETPAEPAGKESGCCVRHVAAGRGCEGSNGRFLCCFRSVRKREWLVETGAVERRRGGGEASEAASLVA